MPGVGNRAASFAGVFRPLIAERSGSGPHLIFPADQSGKEAADSLRHRLPAPQAKVPRRLRSRPSPDRLITVEVRCQGRRQEKASRRPENRLAEHRATWPIIAVIGHVDQEILWPCSTRPHRSLNHRATTFCPQWYTFSPPLTVRVGPWTLTRRTGNTGRQGRGVSGSVAVQVVWLADSVGAALVAVLSLCQNNPKRNATVVRGCGVRSLPAPPVRRLERARVHYRGMRHMLPPILWSEAGGAKTDGPSGYCDVKPVERKKFASLPSGFPQLLSRHPWRKGRPAGEPQRHSRGRIHQNIKHQRHFVVPRPLQQRNDNRGNKCDHGPKQQQ